MKLSLFLFIFMSLTTILSAQNKVGVFENNKDIGNPKISGSASYDEANQTYTISGAGYNIWFERDEHRFLFNQLNGDFILTANFEFVGENDNHRKLGWMVRSSEDANSQMCGAFLHGDGLTAMQWRERTGTVMEEPTDVFNFKKRYVQIIQLERRGKTFIMRAANPGEPLQVVGTKVLEQFPDDVLAGVVICSHDENVIETAKVWNLRIDMPVAENYNPYQSGWIGCRLETMNVFDGKRTVIYEKNDRFEAPNWMRDGEKLLFNMEGLLYSIPATGGEIKQINTGSAQRLNNDHCISFDGKMLGISSNNEQGSTVYILPIEGGEPEQITTKTPSYLHGWSPDGKDLVYAGQRDGSSVFNFFKISIKDKKEIPMTDNLPYGHADGCEYSPDGKYIYYNGCINGEAMQIWRMKPDGTEREQITHDEYNNWFPHISPDGKWMVFISFPPDIDLNSHPSYKRVMLRLMPVSGGAPKVIAYMYGGQGTINVNSWSPDSKHIAFVSNSGKR